MAGKAKLSVRERRAWNKKMSEAQEAVEEAIIARNMIMADAYAAGVAYAGVESATGLGPASVRNAISDPQRAEEGRAADS